MNLEKKVRRQVTPQVPLPLARASKWEEYALKENLVVKGPRKGTLRIIDNCDQS